MGGNGFIFQGDAGQGGNEIQVWIEAGTEDMDNGCIRAYFRRHPG